MDTATFINYLISGLLTIAGLYFFAELKRRDDKIEALEKDCEKLCDHIEELEMQQSKLLSEERYNRQREEDQRRLSQMETRLEKKMDVVESKVDDIPDILSKMLAKFFKQ